MPLQTGLFGAITPPLLYAVFAISKYLSVGAVALVWLIVAESGGGAGGDAISMVAIKGIWIDRSIYFGNAEYVEERIFELIGRHESEEVDCIVLDMRSVNGVDASGVAMLRRLAVRLERAGMTVHFAETHAPVLEKLRALDTTVCKYHRTVAEAVNYCGVILDQGNDHKMGTWPR